MTGHSLVRMAARARGMISRDLGGADPGRRGWSGRVSGQAMRWATAALLAAAALLAGAVRWR